MNEWKSALKTLPSYIRCNVQQNESLSRHTSLRVGGPAELLYKTTDIESLATVVSIAQRYGLEHYVLGAGTNVCVSDAGVRGLVIVNSCQNLEIGINTRVDAGYNFMRLFLKTMQSGLSGLEWAVGIPGTVGGALVSNAGAYGGNIVDLVENIEVVETGERKTVTPEWMEFSYRDSRLRRDSTRPATLLRATLRMSVQPKAEIRLRAREIQKQRLLKQPWEPSAGSFFKNIHNHELAQTMPGLPDLMRERGVVTSAFLIDKSGCKGLRCGDAAVSLHHANFVVNRGRATAADIRAVVDAVRAAVLKSYGISLEEEVLYVGDWN